MNLITFSDISQPGKARAVPFDRASRISLRRTALPAAVVLFVIAGFVPAIAQTSGDGPSPAAKPCQAVPNDPAEGKKTNEDDAGRSAENNTARPKLENCDGVLLPPTTGDKEIEEPAPDTGTTPVIPPATIPQQPQVKPR